MREEESIEVRECRKLIENLVENYSSVSNKALAVRVLNRIEGLEIDDEGKVKKGADVERVRKVVSNLENTVGPVALRFIRDAVEETSPSKKVLESLPDEYKRRK